MKAKIQYIPQERQFEPFDLTINVRSKSELNELLARLGEVGIDDLDWSGGHAPSRHEHDSFEMDSIFICSALRAEYNKYREDSLNESN